MALYEDRLFAFLGAQSAPTASDGTGRQVLYRCPDCHRTWFQDGKSCILDLQADQIQTVAQRVSADLAHLPLSICRVCLFRTGGGVVEVDEYGQGEGGFGFHWQLRQPVLLHAISALLSKPWMRRFPNAEDAVPDIVTRPEKLRTVLQHIKQARVPRAYFLLEQQICAELAADNRPGFGHIGTEDWDWQGIGFEMPIPQFRGNAAVTLFFALPPREPIRPEPLFRLWQALAELTLSRRLPGEQAS